MDKDILKNKEWLRETYELERKVYFNGYGIGRGSGSVKVNPKKLDPGAESVP